jgi:hypothetical protein
MVAILDSIPLINDSSCKLSICLSSLGSIPAVGTGALIAVSGGRSIASRSVGIQDVFKDVTWM